MELVSVIIPTYKRKGDIVSRAINSIITQEYKNWEVLIIDDNDDDMYSIDIKSYIDKLNDNRIKYIKNSSNIGSAKSRNIGITLSKGEYITFLDDDDEYLPPKIKLQLEAMISSGADFSITNLNLYNIDNNKLVEVRIRSFIKEVDTQHLLKYHIKYHLTGTNCLMFKREYLIKIGMFDDIDLGDEYYLMEKSILAKGKFIWLDHCYIKAYIHNNDNGLSSGSSKIKCENDLYMHKKKFYKYLNNKDIKYVKMRHFAVIAFAELRRKKYINFLKNSIYCFIFSPTEAIKLIINLK